MERTGHSAAGILSFVAALIARISLGAPVFSVLDTLKRYGPDASNSQDAMLLIGFLVPGLVGGALLGLILGVVGWCSGGVAACSPGWVSVSAACC